MSKFIKKIVSYFKLHYYNTNLNLKKEGGENQSRLKFSPFFFSRTAAFPILGQFFGPKGYIPPSKSRLREPRFWMVRIMEVTCLYPPVLGTLKLGTCPVYLHMILVAYQTIFTGQKSVWYRLFAWFFISLSALLINSCSVSFAI